jgi:hypothetical protein
LAAVCLLLGIGWLVLRRPRLSRRFVMADLVGGASFGLVTVLLIRPYLAVAARYPEAERTEEAVRRYSPPWKGFFVPSDLSRLFSGAFAGTRSTFPEPQEMVVLPGFVLMALGLVGLCFSAWPLRRRIALLTCTAVLVVLTFGTNVPFGGRITYLVLYHHAPGWDALRTPGRLVIWVTLGLCLLAAGAVTEATERISVWARGREPSERGNRWRMRWVAVAAVLFVAPLGIIAEGWGRVPQVTVSASPVPVTALPAPLLFLPQNRSTDYQIMTWSTDGFPLLSNGASGFVPNFQIRLRKAARHFPDAESVAALRRRGIRTVILLRSRTAGTAWDRAADRSVEGLGITRVDTGDAIVYGL